MSSEQAIVFEGNETVGELIREVLEDRRLEVVWVVGIQSVVDGGINCRCVNKQGVHSERFISWSDGKQFAVAIVTGMVEWKPKPKKEDQDPPVPLTPSTSRGPNFRPHGWNIAPFLSKLTDRAIFISRDEVNNAQMAALAGLSGSHCTTWKERGLTFRDQLRWYLDDFGLLKSRKVQVLQEVELVATA